MPRDECAISHKVGDRLARRHPANPMLFAEKALSRQLVNTGAFGGGIFAGR